MKYLSLDLSLCARSARSTGALVTTRTLEVRLSAGSDGSRNLNSRKVFKVERLQEFL